MGWWGGDRLCQTRLIPRSPDGDNISSHLKTWTSYIVSIRLWKGKFWLIALTRFLCIKNMLVPLGCPFLNHIIHYWGHCSCLWGEESMSWYMWSCAFFPQILFSYDPSRIFLIPGDTTGPTTRNITSCKEAWPRCQGKPRPSRVSVFVPRGKNISSN